MRSRRSRFAATAACLVVTLVAACTSNVGSTDGPARDRTTGTSTAPRSPDTVAPPPKPAPIDPAAVDATNPEAVAEAVATASVTWDTTVDVSDFDGIRRVSALLTPALAATLAPVEHPAPGPEWADAASAKSYNAPTVYTAEDTHGAPPDTAAEVYRAYTATWVWVSSGGTVRTDPRTRTIYLTIALQPDGRWLVSTFDYTDL
ncbi:hypothetical protein CLV47_11841 [Antricoccus suffuscus]|uniref:Mce-associated membrane protein n=1 Tax=Antricoccus suffuscus TaxID=1629062 RepID=A0A2T0ZTT9_9ACTN|nr:hypothetical protein [Antricoccus suffuscus]PRZ39677.1 hypothetical protein CLV47_11841 [Antricoccus suffuscus]